MLGVPSVCLVGVTGFGRVHYDDLMEEHRRGRMRLRAVTIVNPEECPEQLARLRAMECAIYDDYRAMLAAHRGECRLCFLPTGIHWHRPMTVAALEAGMNVYVEKPAASTVQDVRAMREAERATGHWVAVGYQSMYALETPVMKETLLSGRLGALRSVKFYGLWPRNDTYYARNNWSARLRVGDAWVLDSPFHNALGHQLNMILYLAGATMATSAVPTKVTAELYRARPVESCDTAAVRIDTRDGVPVYFWLTHVPDNGDTHEGPLLEARCDRGRIRWALNPRGEWRDGTWIEPEGEDAVAMPAQMGPGGSPVRLTIMDRLRAKLRDPSVFVCGLEVAGVQVAAVNAIHDAATPVDFPKELVTTVGEGPGSLREVKGLCDLIRRGFAEEKLFSELGVAWAKAGTADAEGYAEGRRDFPAH